MNQLLLLPPSTLNVSGSLSRVKSGLRPPGAGPQIRPPPLPVTNTLARVSVHQAAGRGDAA